MIDFKPFSTGVEYRQERLCDVFIGTAECLIAAGLIQLQQLPGQPGNGPTSATFYADGSKVERGRHWGRVREAGKKTIRARRMGGQQVFEVWVTLSKQQIDALQAKERRAATCWPFPVCIGSPPTTGARP